MGDTRCPICGSKFPEADFQEHVKTCQELPLPEPVEIESEPEEMPNIIDESLE